MQATEKAKGQERIQAAKQPAATTIDLDEDDQVDPRKEIAYLQAAGWTKVRANESPNPTKRWKDPLSGKQDRLMLVVPEVRDVAGRLKKEAVYQNVTGSAPWFYSRQEAVQIQRDRDAEKQKKGRQTNKGQ